MRRALALLAPLFALAPANAEVRRYVIAIGNNAPPADATQEPLRALKYADDDAAAMVQLAQSFARAATLLTVLDAESQRRFPAAAAVARPPTLAELRRVLAEHRQRFEADRRAGHEPVLLFFFSGHGYRDRLRGPALALLDGPLTRELLYNEVLAPLGARFVHLFIDACHAEAMVRPKDGSAEIVDVPEAARQRWLDRETLARFPNVGAILATAAGDQAHEWNVLQNGVFTHLLLSGLRGAADVNGDRRIEYSELHAFLSAADRDLVDPRAKLRVQVRVPPLNERVALVDLRAAKGVGWAKEPPIGTRFHVESASGERLVTANAEAGFGMAFALPAGVPLFLRTPSAEAIFEVHEGGAVSLRALPRAPASIAPRGSIAAALDRGLFVTAYGPSYYRGFVDRAGGVSVEFASLARGEPISAPSPTPARAAWIASGALAAASAITGALALKARSDWQGTSLERAAADARSRYDLFRTTFFLTSGAAAAAAITGAILCPWGRARVQATPLPHGLALGVQAHW
jgi:hypothetical protein